jgi:Ni,Fe-hydrogenase III large subunit/Ni,Fe-hydrogenase III component G
MNRKEISLHIERNWPGQTSCRFDAGNHSTEIMCGRDSLSNLCHYLFHDCGLGFAGLVVEEDEQAWRLRYVFYGDRDIGWFHVLVSTPLGVKEFPSIAAQAQVFAADWHEREAEDLFGLVFTGHPRLGDFILHNDAWQESVEPMRHGFDAQAALTNRRPDQDWRPRRVVQEAGAFIMPVGPKFSGVTESVHFQLETVGEDVIRSWTRLFYKWRAVEKLAEGKSIEDGLLLAERFAATTAFAHGLAYCQAVENITATAPPPRAQQLRVFLAELERLRQHAGAIQEICESTALVVANAQAGILEEDLLRISCTLTGHRYLFGLLTPGGLTTDLSLTACRKALQDAARVVVELEELERRLAISSSFLDRIEEVGVIFPRTAISYSLVGPVARASGLSRDLRRAQPYAGYASVDFDVPVEQEGDGYARLRVLFAETRQSLRIMEQAVNRLEEGQVHMTLRPVSGSALGWTETPRGATFHWIRLDEGGRILRYRIVTPSFINWHSFHLAAEKFAFQDFPIILSTFDLSVAENDR